jgi:hypothetical protein
MMGEVAMRTPCCPTLDAIRRNYRFYTYADSYSRKNYKGRPGSLECALQYRHLLYYTPSSMPQLRDCHEACLCSFTSISRVADRGSRLWRAEGAGTSPMRVSLSLPIACAPSRD